MAGGITPTDFWGVFNTSLDSAQRRATLAEEMRWRREDRQREVDQQNAAMFDAMTLRDAVGLASRGQSWLLGQVAPGKLMEMQRAEADLENVRSQIAHRGAETQKATTTAADKRREATAQMKAFAASELFKSPHARPILERDIAARASRGEIEPFALPGQHVLPEGMHGPQVLPQQQEIAGLRSGGESEMSPNDQRKAVGDRDQATADLAKELQMRPEFKTAQEVRAAAAKVSGAPPTSVGDQSLLYGYLKLLDPGSTVRESEYDAAKDSQGAYGKLGGLWRRVVDGHKLTDDQRRQFKAESQRLAATQMGKLRPVLEDYVFRSERLGIDPRAVLGHLTPEPQEVTTEAAPAAKPKKGGPAKQPPHLAGFSPDELSRLRAEAEAGDPIAKQLLGVQ